MKFRCDAILLQLVVTEHDDLGRPVGEKTTELTKVFRANVRDFWNEVDKTVAMLAKEQPPAGDPPQAEKPKGKRAR